jgi:hypothetical protein
MHNEKKKKTLKELSTEIIKSLIKESRANIFKIIFILSSVIIFPFVIIKDFVMYQIGIFLITSPFVFGVLGLVGFISAFLMTDLRFFFALMMITGCIVSYFIVGLWERNKKILATYYIISSAILVCIIISIFFLGNMVIQSAVEKISADSVDKISIVKNTLLWQGINFNNTYNKTITENVLHRFPYKPMLCKIYGSGWMLDSQWTAIAKCGSCGEYTKFFIEVTKRMNIENRQINSYGRDHTWAEVNINDDWIPVETTSANGYNDSSFYDCNNTVSFSYVTYKDSEGREIDITRKYLCPQDIGNLIVHTAENVDVIIKTSFKNISKKADSDGIFETDLGIGNYTVTVANWLFQNEKSVQIKPGKTTEVSICPSKINYYNIGIIILPIVLVLEIFIIKILKKKKK